jgi:C1A family cysteine protease
MQGLDLDLAEARRSVKRKYSWIPDRADPRDRLYQVPRRFLGLPLKIDLQNWCSPVEDQGPLGSCTGNASVGALEFLELKADPHRAGYGDLSRLMAYYNGRAIEGTVRQDAGCEIRDVVKGLAKWGTCVESLYPYDVKRFTRKPTPVAYASALPRRITTYHRIVGLDAMRACLAEGYPVIFGFTVYESFEGDEVARTGVLQMPSAGERELGGHAVLAVGYDDGAQRVIVRNSWGMDWGQKGYFTMPYAYIKNASLSDDFWTIRK